jgi:hypothetical protein
MKGGKMDKGTLDIIKLTIVFTVFAVLCAGFLYMAVRGWASTNRDKQRATAMQTWPVTTGTAKKWRVYIYRKTSRSNDYYRAGITYEYSVDAKVYSKYADVSRDNGMAITFAFNPAIEDRKEKAKKDAEALARSIVEQGKQIDIYYNPQDPSDSVLEKMDVDAISHTGDVILIVVLSLLLLVFISVPLYFWGMAGYSRFFRFTGR